MNKINEFKLIFLGLFFEYAVFIPLWSNYILGQISLTNINLFGFTALTGMSVLILGIAFYYLNKYAHSKNILLNMFFINIILVISISIIAYFIDLNKKYKTEALGFETHSVFFSGLWLKDEFADDYKICISQNINLYQCFEGSDISPWLFPYFYKNFQFINITILISQILIIVYVVNLLRKYY